MEEEEEEEEDDDDDDEDVDDKLLADSLVVSAEGSEEDSGSCLEEEALCETGSKTSFLSLAVTHTQNALRNNKQFFIS